MEVEIMEKEKEKEKKKKGSIFGDPVAEIEW